MTVAHAGDVDRSSPTVRFRAISEAPISSPPTALITQEAAAACGHPTVSCSGTVARSAPADACGAASFDAPRRIGRSARCYRGHVLARITTIDVPPERLAEFEQLTSQGIGPSSAGVPGQLLGFYLIDRKSGRVLMVAIWDSEDALDRTEAPLRDMIARAQVRCGARLVSRRSLRSLLAVRRPTWDLHAARRIDTFSGVRAHSDRRAARS